MDVLSTVPADASVAAQIQFLARHIRQALLNGVPAAQLVTILAGIERRAAYDIEHAFANQPIFRDLDRAVVEAATSRSAPR